ncbi:3-deoxy-D-manno-octulosonic acid transferase [Shimia abyssi]|uniref:3-deoxy-D-manno-octulosonic acid transferase n=1 Tax=Shimia abyssi TaxID=1662395 RepID=A0A2P8FEK5_9RHOB|nr:glycosyltransferase N-terminal domain-containing protein [Shimia abyssi]PSL20156.1 3-deoxy-D-manno-octulosonic-acid transferase [Shimia abyssi]
MSGSAPFSLQMACYKLLRPLLQPIMRRVLAHRVKSGKDDPVRSQEKLGLTDLSRPKGTLIWLHAVGLGEVLALRPLITEMRRQRPDLQFLITSTARSAGKVIGDNLPDNTMHQFLPLDGPLFVKRFLNHWQPDLSIWSEQDLWPGAIMDTARRGIPLAYINARITPQSYQRRKTFRGLYRKMLAQFEIVTAQNQESAQFLEALGAHDVKVMPSLKPAAEPLRADAGVVQEMQQAIGTRKVWVAASTHKADEDVVLEAHKILLKRDPQTLLVLVPRIPVRAPEIATTLAHAGFSFAQRSIGQPIAPETSVYLADSFGELGVWYRISNIALIGASFDGLGGHNPWEAVCLSNRVLHGPGVHNFISDYQILDAQSISEEIADTPQAAQEIADKITSTKGAKPHANADRLIDEARSALEPLAAALLKLEGHSA